MASDLELRHLTREVRTALELAVVALAPTETIDALAKAAGLLEVLSVLPTDCAPASALVPRTVSAARSALDAWLKWERANLKKASA